MHKFRLFNLHAPSELVELASSPLSWPPPLPTRLPPARDTAPGCSVYSQPETVLTRRGTQTLPEKPASLQTPCTPYRFTIKYATKKTTKTIDPILSLSARRAALYVIPHSHIIWQTVKRLWRLKPVKSRPVSRAVFLINAHQNVEGVAEVMTYR